MINNKYVKRLCCFLLRLFWVLEDKCVCLNMQRTIDLRVLCLIMSGPYKNCFPQCVSQRGSESTESHWMAHSYFENVDKAKLYRINIIITIINIHT